MTKEVGGYDLQCSTDGWDHKKYPIIRQAITYISIHDQVIGFNKQCCWLDDLDLVSSQIAPPASRRVSDPNKTQPCWGTCGRGGELAGWHSGPPAMDLASEQGGNLASSGPGWNLCPLPSLFSPFISHLLMIGQESLFMRKKFAKQSLCNTATLAKQLYSKTVCKFAHQLAGWVEEQMVALLTHFFFRTNHTFLTFGHVFR